MSSCVKILFGFLLFISLFLSADAQMLRDIESEPPPSNVKQRQQAVLKKFRSKVRKLAVQYDRSGNVTMVMASNHKAYQHGPSENEKNGLTDDDMERLTVFSELKRFGVEKQKVTEKGLKVLKRFPDMRELRLHYMPEGISPDFICVAGEMEKLRTLEVKHNFRFRTPRIAIGKLNGFPELRRLVLDNDAATPRAMSLILGSPKLRTLRLHRTTLDDDHLSQIIRKHSDLEELWLRPYKKNKQLTDQCFQFLGELSNLKRLLLGAGFMPFQYEGGLEYIADMETLSWIRFENPKKAFQDEAVKTFFKKRPDLEY